MLCRVDCRHYIRALGFIGKLSTVNSHYYAILSAYLTAVSLWFAWLNVFVYFVSIFDADTSFSPAYLHDWSRELVYEFLRSKHMKGLKERYLLEQKHTLQILWVIPFIKLQNDA